ncbi:class I SAM-dependent methyltransferase [Haliangium sp.]|uniref:class I SAM-dependent methyltransferase n=1 Tax=Haliangium sp. TaxID=2663208 RepID=UPI003D0CE1E4
MDHRDIYAHHADAYDELVAAEDCDGRLVPALQAALAAIPGGGLALDRARVVEVGAGTGRITRLLAQAGAEILATEPSPAMLEVARRHLPDHPRVRFAQAAADAVPVADGWADVGIAGWVFGHFRMWMPAEWQTLVGRALAELERAVRPGGAVIVIETLGTGETEPAPPSPGLGEYYRWLEDRGFARTWIRTDYGFADVEEAARVGGFFFGPEFAERARDNGWQRVPECTGLWTWHKDASS